jgi:hypothetical protein
MPNVCMESACSIGPPNDDGIEPWLNLGNAAKLLKIAPKTLRLALKPAISEPSIRYRTARGSSPAPR